MIAPSNVPYTALISQPYKYFLLPSLLHMILSWYDVLILHIMSTMIPSNIMYPGCTCGQSPCRNAPGILTVITYLLSIVSIKHNPIRAYIDTVGELDSSFVIYSYCGRPLAHYFAFIFPLCFLLLDEHEMS